MKKTFKRIIALAIVLCTLGAMMIPGVSVTAAAPASKTFDIKADTVAAGVNYNSGNRFWSDGTCQTNLANYYATSGWTIYKNDSGAMLNTGYPPRFYKNGLQFYPNAVSTYAYSVMKITAPGTGDYTLSLKPSVISASDERAEIAGAYIIPYGNYDKWTLPGVNSEAAAAGSKVTLNETSLREQVFHAGEGTVSLVEGQEYLLVFYYYDSTSKTAKADFQAFSLTGVAKYDYTVTYHANYEGAPVATFADSENATGIADATKDITVDSITREGLFKLAGWATTADGEVAYQAGDVISMAGDTTLDLYAIWEETWDPANNTDLVVNFATAFENAGVTSGTYLQSAAAALNGAYATNKWTVYCDATGASIRPNNLYAGGRNRVGYLELRQNNIGSYGATATLPSVFIAPGSGEYKFSVSYGTAASGDYKATEIGAYILPMPETPYTKYNVPMPNNSLILSKATKLNPYADSDGKTGSGTFYAENTVMLEGGKEYMIVFYSVSPSTTNAYANFVSFELTEVKPAATVGGVPYETLDAAISNGQGATVVMMQDAAVEGILDLGTATLNLNGCTITASNIIGTVTDSTNGTGRVATAQTSILTTGADELALWDNTTDAEGYRVFKFTFNSLGIADDQDVATGVEKFIDLYEAERVLVGAENLDENGEVIKGKGDKRFNDVTDDVAALYAAGTIDWRFEYSSQQYQMGRGGVCFSWGNKSIRHYGAGFSAIRIQAPGAGRVSVTLKTASANSADYDGGFDMYIVKASEIENACADYAANFAAFAAAPATAVAETADAFTAAMAAHSAVITGVSNGETYKGDFEFEEGVEYIVIFNNNGSVKGALHMNFKSISFDREAKNGDARTFWSQLAFTNTNAYNLVAASDLNVGIKMDWNGDWKNFDFDAATVNAWAAEEIANPSEDYGFYIRVSGFEKLAEESGVLTGTPYIRVANKTVEAAPMVFNYPVAE